MRSSISYYFSLGFTSKTFCKILRVLLKLKVSPRQQRARSQTAGIAGNRQTEENEMKSSCLWDSKCHKRKFGQNNSGKLPGFDKWCSDAVVVLDDAPWYYEMIGRLWRVFVAMSAMSPESSVTGGRGRDNCQSLSLLQGRPGTRPGHVTHQKHNAAEFLSFKIVLDSWVETGAQKEDPKQGVLPREF